MDICLIHLRVCSHQAERGQFGARLWRHRGGMPATADCRDEPAIRRALRFRRIDVVQSTRKGVASRYRQRKVLTPMASSCNSNCQKTELPRCRRASSTSATSEARPGDWIESATRRPTFNGNVHVRYKVSLPGETGPRTIDPLCENS